jgi:hypothetical protein
MRLAPLFPTLASLTLGLSLAAGDALAQVTTQAADAVYARNAQGQGFDGRGTTVVILDPGGFATSSPGLQGKLAGEGCVNVDAMGNNCPNAQPTQFGAGAATVAWPDSAQGTEMAELAVGSNPGAVGVAPGAHVYLIRVGGTAGSASSTDVRIALENVYSSLRTQFNIAAVVIPLVAGGGEAGGNLCMDAGYRYIVDALMDAGVATIVGAGDSGQTSALQFDGCLLEANAVSSFNADSSPSGASNFSENSTFGAIAVNLASTAGDGAPKTLASGTSFAAALSAGAFAVLKTAHPNASVEAAMAALVAGGLAMTVTDPTPGSPLPQYKVRRIDVSNALNYFTADFAPEGGFWWTPGAGGRGYFVDVQGNAMFFGAFVYNAAGQPNWYVGRLVANGAASYGGTLTLYGGGVQLGSSTYVPPSAIGNIASVQLSFTDADNGTVHIQTADATVDVAVSKYRVFYDNQGMNLQRPQTGWYWDPTQSGSGIAIECLGDSIFMVAFAYDNAGNSQWTATAGSTISSQFAVTTQPALYVNGQTLTGPYSAPSIAGQPLGTIQLRTMTPHTLTVVYNSGLVATYQRFRFLDP